MIEYLDDEYEFPSNEQRLDYLDNPERTFTPIRDFNFKVVLHRKYYEKKTRAGLLQGRSEEDEVS